MNLRLWSHLIRLFGLRNLLRTKWRHDRALPHIRGYAATSCLWTLLHTGVIDIMVRRGEVSARALATELNLDMEVLTAILEYLDGIGLMREESHGHFRFTRRGVALMEEPRGLFELLHGYEPIFIDLEALTRGTAVYGRDLVRRGDFVARGSGMLGRQLPFPVVREIVQRRGHRRLLDIGCGNCETLAILCEDPQIECVGIDHSEEAIAEAQTVLDRTGLRDRVTAIVGDMFALPSAGGDDLDFDAIIAIDVYHEYVRGGIEQIEKLLAGIRERFPGATMIVAEFCKQPKARLRRHPSAFIEHHLFHVLSHQTILEAAEWRSIFTRAGWTIVEEQIYDMVGHGYFVLE